MDDYSKEEIVHLLIPTGVHFWPTKCPWSNKRLPTPSPTGSYQKITHPHKPSTGFIITYIYAIEMFQKSCHVWTQISFSLWKFAMKSVRKSWIFVGTNPKSRNLSRSWSSSSMPRFLFAKLLDKPCRWRKKSCGWTDQNGRLNSPKTEINQPKQESQQQNRNFWPTCFYVQPTMKLLFTNSKKEEKQLTNSQFFSMKPTTIGQDSCPLQNGQSRCVNQSGVVLQSWQNSSDHP